MSSFPEVEKRLSGQVRLFYRYRLDDDIGAAKEDIALAAGLWTQLTLHHHRELDKVGGAHSTILGIMNELNETVAFWFSEENGDKGRGVKNHFGRPRSS